MLSVKVAIQLHWLPWSPSYVKLVYTAVTVLVSPRSVTSVLPLISTDFVVGLSDDCCHVCIQPLLTFRSFRLRIVCKVEPFRKCLSTFENPILGSLVEHLAEIVLNNGFLLLLFFFLYYCCFISFGHFRKILGHMV